MIMSILTPFPLGAIETLTNAINGAGFDLYVSFDGPYTPTSGDIELFFVFAMGKNPETELSTDIAASVAQLFDGTTPILLQTAGGIR